MWDFISCKDWDVLWLWSVWFLQTKGKVTCEVHDHFKNNIDKLSDIWNFYIK